MTAVAVRPNQRTPWGVAAAAGAGCLALAAWNPGDHGIPICPTKAITGLDCPLCGGLRAVAQLTRGHVGQAASHNLLVVAFAPVAVVWWLSWWWAERNGRPLPRLRIGRVGWSLIAVLVITFTVIRNLPIGGLAHWLNSSSS
jgi:hypothetical protein